MPSVAIRKQLFKNRVLASLTPSDIRSLSPHLLPITLKNEAELARAGRTDRHGLFS